MDNEAYYLETLDSLLDIHEWEDDNPSLDDSSNLRPSEVEIEKVLGEANLDVTRQGLIEELIKVHKIGCVEYLISILFVLEFQWMTYHEILCRLLGKSDKRFGFDVDNATSFWEEWWENNKGNRKYSTLSWRDKSPRLSQALYAFTLPGRTDDLTRLINSPDPVVRLAVARNPRIPSLDKKKLTRDVETHVRLALAVCPKASPEILAILADDSHSIVRRWVASNPNANLETLEELSVDPNPKVRNFLKQNPKWNR